MVLTGILVGGFVALLVLAFVYAWRNRPYRGEFAEEDNAWRDEMALQADKFPNRAHDMGADIGGDL
ncbi:MAG TPA: hypothetical protein VLV15_09585 [Dongiaceae bacterium]|nr:hypothetical protein [Dongiaceae bacterium]